MPWPAIIAAGAQLGGGLIGNAKASKDREAAEKQIQQSVLDLEAIGVPSAQARQIALEQYQNLGGVSPELQDAVKLGDTNLGGISLDPKFKEAQLQALSSMQDIGNSGGLRLQDKADIEKVLAELNQNDRGKREAKIAEMKSRGQFGSGLELAAELDSNQASSQRAHEFGLGVAAEAQKRALDAIAASGTLGGNLRTQDYNEQSKLAEARDLIAKWNAENSQAVKNWNVGTRNTAQQYNLEKAQNLANANVDTRNKQEIANKDAINKSFQDQLDLAKTKASARTGVAQNYNNNADRTAAMWQGMGKGVADTALSVGTYNAQQDTNKQNQANWEKDYELKKKVAAKGGNPYGA